MTLSNFAHLASSLPMSASDSPAKRAPGFAPVKPQLSQQYPAIPGASNDVVYFLGAIGNVSTLCAYSPSGWKAAMETKNPVGVPVTNVLAWLIDGGAPKPPGSNPALVGGWEPLTKTLPEEFIVRELTSKPGKRLVANTKTGVVSLVPGKPVIKRQPWELWPAGEPPADMWPAGAGPDATFFLARLGYITCLAVYSPSAYNAALVGTLAVQQVGPTQPTAKPCTLPDGSQGYFDTYAQVCMPVPPAPTAGGPGPAPASKYKRIGNVLVRNLEIAGIKTPWQFVNYVPGMTIVRILRGPKVRFNPASGNVERDLSTSFPKGPMGALSGACCQACAEGRPCESEARPSSVAGEPFTRSKLSSCPPGYARAPKLEAALAKNGWPNAVVCLKGCPDSATLSMKQVLSFSAQVGTRSFDDDDAALKFAKQTGQPVRFVIACKPSARPLPTRVFGQASGDDRPRSLAEADPYYRAPKKPHPLLTRQGALAHNVAANFGAVGAPPARSRVLAAGPGDPCGTDTWCDAGSHCENGTCVADDPASSAPAGSYPMPSGGCPPPDTASNDSNGNAICLVTAGGSTNKTPIGSSPGGGGSGGSKGFVPPKSGTPTPSGASASSGGFSAMMGSLSTTTLVAGGAALLLAVGGAGFAATRLHKASKEKKPAKKAKR